ncbi:MAG: hypothetical protein Terrestrivirus1_198 [Terrestrivirus sp.]|uniref:DUF1308 domain-containing protein n=1 Tax=Terrestrivirus sp. TaxID=2487775 RepID=A0A3G4ZLN5_9VIRU|nr:MAG: hypothetical protein Terrestrivirus1_198 [Terrestrivirus sp.]
MYVSELLIICRNLLKQCKEHPQNVLLQKISHQIKREVNVIQSMPSKAQYLTSNVVWFDAMVRCLTKTNINDDTTEIDNHVDNKHIDIITHKNKTFIKVSAMSLKRQLDSNARDGDEYSEEKSIIDTGREIMETVSKLPLYMKPTQIYFYFGSGVIEELRQKLELIGIIVVTDSNNIKPIKITRTDAYNLDVTALMALVSYTTNNPDPNTKFSSEILHEQLQLEKKYPFFKQLDENNFSDKKLYVCQTALETFKDIVKIVGGPNERDRADKLIDKLICIPDTLSPEIEEFRRDYILDQKNTTIFGTGDANNLCTITSNMNFINKLKRKKYHLDVLPINCCALSEQKIIQETTQNL